MSFERVQYIQTYYIHCEIWPDICRISDLAGCGPRVAATRLPSWLTIGHFGRTYIHTCIGRTLCAVAAYLWDDPS